MVYFLVALAVYSRYDTFDTEQQELFIIRSRYGLFPCRSGSIQSIRFYIRITTQMKIKENEYVNVQKEAARTVDHNSTWTVLNVIVLHVSALQAIIRYLYLHLGILLRKSLCITQKIRFSD
jgi:hypothetical protein